MDKYALAEKEYEKLISENLLSSEIANDASFRKAFIDRFLFIGDNYTIKVENGDVVLESNSNFPDATNGIYKGYKTAKKIVFKVEREHLTAFEENASIYVMPEQLDTMVYNSIVCAYKNGVEVAFASYEENREVNKDFMPQYALHSLNGSNMVGIPYLNVGNALTCTPINGDGLYKWKSNSSCRQKDGLVFSTQIDHQNQTTDVTTNTWGMIDAVHFDVLHYNTLPFAFNQTQGGISNDEWRTVDGRIITLEELENMKNEYNAIYNDFNEKHR